MVTSDMRRHRNARASARSTLTFRRQTKRGGLIRHDQAKVAAAREVGIVAGLIVLRVPPFTNEIVVPQTRAQAREEVHGQAPHFDFGGAPVPLHQ